MSAKSLHKHSIIRPTAGTKGTHISTGKTVDEAALLYLPPARYYQVWSTANTLCGLWVVGASFLPLLAVYPARNAVVCAINPRPADLVCQAHKPYGAVIGQVGPCTRGLVAGGCAALNRGAGQGQRRQLALACLGSIQAKRRL